MVKAIIVIFILGIAIFNLINGLIVTTPLGCHPNILLRHAFTLQEKHYSNTGKYASNWKPFLDEDEILQDLQRSDDCIRSGSTGYDYYMSGSGNEWYAQGIPLEKTEKNYHYYIDQTGIMRREMGKSATKHSPVYLNLRE